ncbi:MAG: MerR family transcriptional regulator [Polyangiaceae bacterium]
MGDVDRKLTIGELARRTGVSVKRLRFYSDEGLLPPAARSRSGYRLYTEAHVRRIELVRTLRDAGMSLDDIARVLRRDVTLEQALALRLAAVEAHVAGLQRVASAIRTALRSGPTEERLRRIMMVTKTSNEERRRVVERFYDQVVAGVAVGDPAWITGMIEASAPPLPENPTREQLDAWVELEGILGDPRFLACRRANAEDVWTKAPEAVFDVQYAAMAAAHEAREKSVRADSAEARAIVDRLVEGTAHAAGADAAAVRDHMRAKFDPRGARFWELVARVRDDAPPQRFDDWKWLGEALASA